MKFSKIGCALFVAATSFSGSAMAQDGEIIEDIIITGVRTPLAMDEMATAVSVITRQDLDLRQSFQLADVLRDVPGLTVARSGSAGSQAQVRMRGSEANHVLVLIDGVEVNDPASGDEFLFEHLSAMEVERIEVIRGPQSALWGSDAIGGVVNIVTRKGGEGVDAGLTLEGGSFETWRSAMRFGTGTNKWRLSAGHSRSQSEGTNVSRTGDETDGYDLETMQGRASFYPTENFRLDVTARRVEARNEYDPIDFFVTGLPMDGDNVNEAERTVVGGVATFESGAFVHKGGASKLSSDNQNLVDGVLQGTSDARRTKLFYQTTVEYAPGHKMTAAVDYRDTEFMQTGVATMWGDPNQVQSMTNTGYVIDYVGKVEDTFTLTASARHDSNSEFDDVSTWRLGASLAVTDATRLRGSYGSGYKAPTFIELYGFFANNFIGNPGLKPETSKSFEIGVEHVAAGGRAVLGLTWFDATLEDEIDGFVWDPVNFAYTAANKDGESKRRGLEATLDTKLNARVTLGLNYTWTEAEEPDGMGGLKKELRRPEHAGAIALGYGADSGASYSLNASYVGEADDIFFPPWPLPSEQVTLDSYWLVSLAAQKPINDKTEVFARIENAFDATYEDLVGFATPGLGAFVGVRVKL